MAGKRILVVENEAILALNLTVLLTARGYEVMETASTAELALEMTSSRKPDLVLMDVKLGGVMDGIDAAGEIALRRNIPLVFISAATDKETLNRAAALGQVPFIRKPFDKYELFETVDAVLGSPRNARLN